jgi:hypothetical protein
MAIAEEDRVTIDHDAIRRWAEERAGYPATVAGTHPGEEAGVLRIGFDDEPDLDRIGWDEFFEKFEAKALAMRYRNEPEGSGNDRYHEFLKRR